MSSGVAEYTAATPSMNQQLHLCTLRMARDLPLYVVPKSTPTIRRSWVVLAPEAAPIARFALDLGLKENGTLPPLKGSEVLIFFDTEQ